MGRISQNVYVVDGVGRSLAEWSRHSKIGYATLRYRMRKGLSLKSAMSRQMGPFRKERDFNKPKKKTIEEMKNDFVILRQKADDELLYKIDDVGEGSDDFDDSDKRFYALQRAYRRVRGGCV